MELIDERASLPLPYAALLLFAMMIDDLKGIKLHSIYL
jgi:hypothetical protein